jgi:hypothetical protein
MKAMFSLLGFMMSIGVGVQAQVGSSEASCRSYGKDYDSPGFSIPARQGVFIEARFGCRYKCSCQWKSWIVTHVLEERHLDLKLNGQTGGPERAKWFICPFSVDSSTWKPYRDLVGRVIAWNVEPNEKEFPAENMSSSPQIKSWMETSCQNP